ncbi:hypothetical protein PSQ19_03050 [Devosia algicola]|uniref:Uncharacterized protein n=1 Tax=Devosia algicola TaxID=3026418 RepID=A0ABY7YPJ4_9HYPH|nr:hypothetical protein [Devosia algicola]WDR03181.1 hypothetical protein PSQ19_03050 [Devosia algicola]
MAPDFARLPLVFQRKYIESASLKLSLVFIMSIRRFSLAAIALLALAGLSYFAVTFTERDRATAQTAAVAPTAIEPSRTRQANCSCLHNPGQTELCPGC